MLDTGLTSALPPAQVVADPWHWQPHPEVWLMIACVIALGFYVSRVIAPKIDEVVTRRQKIWFAIGVGLLWFASDWPMHDIAEQYLYSVHMVQHMILTLIMPPVFLLATPTWLAHLVVHEGEPGWSFARRAANPVVAAVVFNGLVLATHWSNVVNYAVQNGTFHYTVHLVMVTSAIVLWIPVCGPWPELRLSVPGAMVYLFLQSIIPTVPGAWLTMAETPVYTVYDHLPRLWDISVIQDQMTAGFFMKLGAGSWLWAIIITMFFRWSLAQERAGSNARIVHVDA